MHPSSAHIPTNSNFARIPTPTHYAPLHSTRALRLRKPAAMQPREHARTTSRSTAPFEIAAPHLPCCTGYEPDLYPLSRIGAETYGHHW